MPTSSKFRVAVALLYSLLQVGCLTEKVLDKYEEGRPLEAARLEVLAAGPSMIRLAWETSHEGTPPQSGVIEFDTRLPDCQEVDVLIQDASTLLPMDPGEPPALQNEPTEESPLETQALGPCDVVILARKMSDADLTLHASNSARNLGNAAIEGPNSHLWLAAVPATAVADTAIFVSVAAVVGPPVLAYWFLYSMGHSDTPTTWTWTP